MKLDVHQNVISNLTSHTPYHTPDDITHLNRQKLSNSENEISNNK